MSDAAVSVSCVPWFPGCRIRNGENGIHFLLNRDGRRRGDALIELESRADVQRALEKNLRYMGPRYVKGGFSRRKRTTNLINRLSNQAGGCQPGQWVQSRAAS